MSFFRLSESWRNRFYPQGINSIFFSPFLYFFLSIMEYRRRWFGLFEVLDANNNRFISSDDLRSIKGVRHSFFIFIFTFYILFRVWKIK